MAGAYQAVVVVTAGFATMARTRMPERAASTQALAVVNMGVREPQVPRSVNAINRWRASGGRDGARGHGGRVSGRVRRHPEPRTVSPLPTGSVVTRVEPGIPCPQAQRWRSAPARAQCRAGVPGRSPGAPGRRRPHRSAPPRLDRPLPAGRQRRRHRRLPPPRRPGLGRAPHGHRAAPPRHPRRAPRAGHLLLRASAAAGPSAGSRSWARRAAVDRRRHRLGARRPRHRPAQVTVGGVPRPLRHRGRRARGPGPPGPRAGRPRRSPASPPSRGSRAPPTSTCSTTPTTPWGGRSSSSSGPASSTPTASAAATRPMS